MNVLILAGKFGFGHMSAAYSIKDKIIKEGNCDVEVIDLIEYLFPKLNKIVYCLFDFLVGKCSHLYNFLNKYASKSTSAPLKKVNVKKIERLIKEKNIDLIISVLPICSQYISAFKKTTGSKIIMYTVITDVDVHREWLNSGTSKYFVSSNETKEFLVYNGINNKDISVSGIPVKSEFCDKSSLGKTEVLIMGGGLGLIPGISNSLDVLEKYDNIHVNVILGYNKKLYNKLYKKYKNINIIGFTDKVYEYMNKATLIVTKAGGITMSEAIRSETPILCLKPFLAQEVGNALYIERKGIGKVLWKNKKYIHSDIIEMVEAKEKINVMKNNMRNVKLEFENVSYTGELL